MNMIESNPDSSPPRPSTCSFPERFPNQSVRMHTEKLFDDGVEDDIFSHRRSQYAEIFPSYSSSPIRLRRASEEASDRKMAQQRHNRADNLMKMRGGIEEMEKFVMNSEREREWHSLRLQAEANAIPMDQVEQFENEQREELEDEQLIEYVVKRDQCIKELDQMLADMLIT